MHVVKITKIWRIQCQKKKANRFSSFSTTKKVYIIQIKKNQPHLLGLDFDSLSLLLDERKIGHKDFSPLNET